MNQLAISQGIFNMLGEALLLRILSSYQLFHPGQEGLTGEHAVYQTYHYNSYHDCVCRGTIVKLHSCVFLNDCKLVS